MIVPVRWFSCGKGGGDKWEPFQMRVAAGENPKEVLDDLKLERYCCRRMLISHVEIVDELIKYDEADKSKMSIVNID